jgi:hypothetical protein
MNSFTAPVIVLAGCLPWLAAWAQSERAPSLPSAPTMRPMPTVSPGPAPAPALQPMLAPPSVKMPITMMQIQVVPSLCKSVPEAAVALNNADNALHQAGGNATSTDANHAIWYFGNEVKNTCCSPNVSYSVADQQAAGCIGGDSLDACMTKLTRQCIRKVADSKGVSIRLQQISQGVGNLSQKAAENLKQANTLQGLLP